MAILSPPGCAGGDFFLYDAMPGVRADKSKPAKNILNGFFSQLFVNSGMIAKC
jgi:hypothetical protein